MYIIKFKKMTSSSHHSVSRLTGYWLLATFLSIRNIQTYARRFSKNIPNIYSVLR